MQCGFPVRRKNQVSTIHAAVAAEQTARSHRQAQLDHVHGVVEGPGELVAPQRLHHHVLHVRQLVGLPPGRGRVVHLWGGHVGELGRTSGRWGDPGHDARRGRS